METTDLTSTTYWNSQSIDLRCNPRRATDSSGLLPFLEKDCGIHSAIVVATSGSTGHAKFVVLSKAATLASAKAVNAFCGLTANDHWFCTLPTFHVGGLGIFARAHCNGAQITTFPWDQWSGTSSQWVDSLARCRATLASLTPTHLFDLVAGQIRCPDSLRGLFLGGGKIDPALVAEARALGWPVWPTYGMSEAASQIATSIDGNAVWLSVLPHWECATSPSGRLKIRGPALFSGYANRSQERWEFHPACDQQGWFTTGDFCEMKNNRIRFLGRGDDAVKVSGELVALARLNARAESLGIPGAILAVPHPRTEHELVLRLAKNASRSNWLEIFNRGIPSIERATKIIKHQPGTSEEVG